MYFRQMRLLFVLASGLLLFLLLKPPLPVLARELATENKVIIYFFWGDGCPHCARAKPFLEELAKTYPEVEVRAYEVWYVDENLELFKKMAAAYGFEPTAVPTILSVTNTG